MMQLLQAAQALQAELQGADVLITGVSSDSRHIAPGQLFVALRGDRFDGHEFLSAVAAQGAAAVLVDRAWAEQAQSAPLPVLVVADTRLALGQLAAYWRRQFDIPLVGVTGSNGKTTVKDMTTAILRAQAQLEGLDPHTAVLATQGNLNNDIGLPLTLLGLNSQTRFAVAEMGMNHPGEIAYLADIAQPNVAVVTNAQRAHLAGMGGLEQVAAEKGSIYQALGSDGVAIVNGGDAYCAYWCDLNRERTVLTFGLHSSNHISARYQAKGLGFELHISTPEGDTELFLPVPGVHNVGNALAATGAALAACVSLEAVRLGLSNFQGVKGRLQRKKTACGALLLDDSYNANPDSLRAAVDVLAAMPGKTILVMGDMGETGEQAGQLHDEIGGYAKSQGVDRLFGLGELSEMAVHNFGPGAQHFHTLEALVDAVQSELTPDTVLLVKGSRFMRMERVVNALAVQE